MRRRLPRIHGPSRASVAVGAAAITLVLALAFPRVYPAARMGVSCTDLASPIGGNNRSLLAQAGDDTQNLDLELSVATSPIAPGEPLDVAVTFVNRDIGPIILYFGSQQPPITTDTTHIGLRFEITRLDGSPLLNQGAQVPPAGWPSTSVNPNALHLLGSRSRCTEEVAFRLGELVGGGLLVGDYRIQAFYSNNNPGVLRAPAPGEPAPTATPAYTDQGIWTGSTSSQEVRFSVSSAP